MCHKDISFITYFRFRQKRFGQASLFLLASPTSILFLLFLFLFVFDKFFLLLQDLQFLLVAGFVRVDFQFSFVEL